MSCEKKNRTGSCSHFQCPFPALTHHGYECVGIFEGFCEVGAGCLKQCTFSYEEGDPVAKEAMDRAFHQMCTEEEAIEAAKTAEAEDYDRDLNQFIRENDEAEYEATMTEMTQENVVYNFMCAHPIEMMSGALDRLFYAVESEEGFPEGQRIEHLINVAQNIEVLFEALSDDFLDLRCACGRYRRDCKHKLGYRRGR